VMEQPTADLPPGSVATVLQSGFVLHDRVLRPATVTVAKDPNA
jgi:molecular chaperone GrpE